MLERLGTVTAAATPRAGAAGSSAGSPPADIAAAVQSAGGPELDNARRIDCRTSRPTGQHTRSRSGCTPRSPGRPANDPPAAGRVTPVRLDSGRAPDRHASVRAPSPSRPGPLSYGPSCPTFSGSTPERGSSERRPRRPAPYESAAGDPRDDRVATRRRPSADLPIDFSPQHPQPLTCAMPSAARLPTVVPRCSTRAPVLHLTVHRLSTRHPQPLLGPHRPYRASRTSSGCHGSGDGVGVPAVDVSGRTAGTESVDPDRGSNRARRRSRHARAASAVRRGRGRRTSTGSRRRTSRPSSRCSAACC